MIALYFGILLRRRLVGRPPRQGHGRRLLPGRPQPRLVGHRRLDLRLEHRLRARRRPGRLRRHGRRGAWRTTSCTPGACWCWPGSSCRSTRARMVFTMPEFLERRFSHRLALRALDRLAHHVRRLEDRGRHLRRRRRVRDAAAGAAAQPRRRSRSTASGSARSLVIVLTGLYTALGGMRAVAYNDAVQVVVLIGGSAAADDLRPATSSAAGASCARICGSDMFNLWKPLIPPGVEGTWAPVLEKNAAGQVVRAGLVLQRQLPLARHGHLRADHRPVVLVHRPVHRAARARRARTSRWPAAAASSPPS